MDDINDIAEVVNGEKPFDVDSDSPSEEFKYRSYWFKVRC